jgi:hypothetical protein
VIPAEDAPTLGQSLLAILRKVWPGLFFTGVHSFEVVSVAAEVGGNATTGRITMKPSKTKLFGPKETVVQWSGCAGGVAIPKVGSRVAVVFMDHNPDEPVIVGFQPLSVNGGRPLVTELDASTAVRLGRNATTTTVGSPAAAHLVARADVVDANFAALSTSLDALSGALALNMPAIVWPVPLTTLPTFAPTAVTKLKSE